MLRRMPRSFARAARYSGCARLARHPSDANLWSARQAGRGARNGGLVAPRLPLC